LQWIHDEIKIIIHERYKKNLEEKNKLEEKKLEEEDR
jgi:hypothetical protein